ncbi:MAG: two-component regulator propeller domain-containing protein, partial [Cyclobacteriaceae bacterium]
MIKYIHHYALLWTLVFCTFCKGQNQTDLANDNIESKTKDETSDRRAKGNTFSDYKDQEATLIFDPQIAEYIRHIFQDKNGNLWFGTGGNGVAYYDGDRVSYFSNAQGFHGQQITGITEDPEKNMWFATDQGVVKYDWLSNDEGGKRFANYTDQQYFGAQRF